MGKLLMRLMREDDGQDLVEYALLTAAIGLAGVATWPLIEAGIGDAYRKFDRDTQNIWEVPNPGSN